MNLYTKKIIAREFILFLLCLAISLVVFICIYISTVLNKSKIRNINSQITVEKKIIDSLEEVILKERPKLELVDEFGIPIRKKTKTHSKNLEGMKLQSKT